MRSRRVDQSVEESGKSGDSSTGKRTMGLSQTLQPKDYRWTIFKATERGDISGGQKEEKVNEDGGHCQCRRRR